MSFPVTEGFAGPDDQLDFELATDSRSEEVEPFTKAHDLGASQCCLCAGKSQTIQIKRVLKQQTEKFLPRHHHESGRERLGGSAPGRTATKSFPSAIRRRRQTFLNSRSGQPQLMRELSRLPSTKEMLPLIFGRALLS